MEKLRYMILKSQYRDFISIIKNKILLKNVAGYKKIEIIVELTSFLDEKNIFYNVNENLNIEISTR